MKRCIFIFILLSWHVMSMAAVSMQITPSSARLGETINLTLSLDGMSSNGVPDITPLEKNFTIIGTEHNVSYTAANGVAKSERQWIITLIAKKSGTIPIPPIQVGQQYSAPGQVTITTNAQATVPDSQDEALENDEIMLHAQLSKSDPFINEQVIYTVKLYSRTPVMNAEYQPPHVEDALFIPLGDGRRYQTTINGREYAVDEQQYALFPQKSGELNIIPPQFNAVIYGVVPKRTQVNGPAMKLAVKPIPEIKTKQPWFPASHVSLSEQYAPSSKTIVQGDTITRTITLRAVAMPAELLPTLEFPENKQFSMYPEKPETRNVLRQQALVGTSVTKVTYLLNQAGDIILPAIKLAWFNTVTGKQEMATLPEHKVTVTAKTVAQINSPKQTKVKPNHLSSRLALWITAAFIMIMMIVIALWWWFRHRSVVITPSLPSALTRLRKACATNDPTMVHIALLDWGNMQWPNSTLLNLSRLGNLVQDSALKKQINLLSEILYSKKSQSTWNGNALWRAVKSYRSTSSIKKGKNNALPPMNPDME